MLVEVLDEGSVTARTEEQLAVFRAERRTVGVRSNRVGGRQLLAERHVIAHTEFLLEFLEVVGDMLTEERQVVVADGEMQIDNRFLAVFGRFGTVQCALYQVLQRGRTCAVAVLMEKEQALRQFSVVHVLQQVTHGFLPFLTGELRAERKAVFMRQKILNERRLDAVLEVLEQVLEHTAGRTRSRNELQDLMSLFEVLLPSSDILLLLRAFRGEDALLRRCRRYDVQLRKTVSEAR